MSDSLQPHGQYSPWNSPGQNTGEGSLSLLQRIFPTQGSNPGLLHCGQILYQLSHKGSPRILECVAYPFFRNLPNPGIELGSPALQADSLPTELLGKPYSRRWIKKILLWFMSKSVLPMFSSKSFIISGLTLRSLIHVEFIFMYNAGSVLISFVYM